MVSCAEFARRVSMHQLPSPCPPPELGKTFICSTLEDKDLASQLLFVLRIDYIASDPTKARMVIITVRERERKMKQQLQQKAI
jgi:hypothetical protein